MGGPVIADTSSFQPQNPVWRLATTAIALAPPPRFALQAAANSAARIVTRRHRALVERLLDSLAGKTFFIDPEDLPFGFVLRPEPQRLRLDVVGRRTTPRCDASIRGPLRSLIDLVEGRVDGDALFFSRKLHISGDTEAVVALRNIVDGAEVDLVSDFASAFGMISAPVERILRRISEATQPPQRPTVGTWP